MDAQTESRGIVVIPARLASTRLPNKLLLDQTGRPLLSYVIDHAQEAVRRSQGLLREVVVACDDLRLAEIAEQTGARAIMTGDYHQCGTTRIAEALEKLHGTPEPDFVVNVQGDEPELDPRAILKVAHTLLDGPAHPMATLVLAMPYGTEDQKQNPNAVKAVLNDRGEAIYFSRAPIPFDRHPVGPDEVSWHHHLGIYAYRTSFLLKFAGWPVSSLERQESLEQLRAIQAGYTIAAADIPHHWAGKGIDTFEDYQAFVARTLRRAA